MTNEIQAVLNQITDLQQAQRRRSLYSDLTSQKRLNPTTYERNIKIWKKIILSLLEHRLLSEDCAPWVFNIENINFKLSWKDPYSQSVSQPLGIYTVLEELIKQGKLCVPEQYLKGNKLFLTQPSFYQSTINNIIAKIMGETEIPDLKSQRKLIVKKYLKEYTQQLLDQFQNSCIYFCTDKLLDLLEFKQSLLLPILKKKNLDLTLDLNSTDLLILVMGLKERGVMVTENDELGLVLKFPSPKDIVAYLNNEQAIPNTNFNQIDYNILSLKKTYNSLNSQITDLEEKINSLKKQCKKYYSTGLTTQAMFSFKRLNLIKEVLNKRSNSFHSIHNIIHQIQSCETDYQIHLAYQAGTDTIKSMISEYGLSVDNVESTMNDLREVLTDTAEVQEAMHQPLINNEDDSELEAELEALMKEVPEETQTVEAIKKNSNDKETQLLTNQLKELAIANTPLSTLSNDSPTRPVKRVKSDSPDKLLLAE
ncbi:hypothetical protein K502DRAFT_325615 [Neoconidiobolus thromboides FSU 785]|nr:hypothetical protein K502DRAFT_325615 [Neoconidiobolus thromboides FSU 785]